MLIIVGSGRCGTKSFADFYNGVHEPNQEPVTHLASSYSHGWLTQTQTATLLSTYTWPKVFADYKQSELIEVTSHMDPEPDYLWLVRNPADTVASMVAKRWYLPEDDDYPPGFLSFYRQHHDPDEDRPIVMTAFNQPGNRTKGYLVGDFSLSEWSNLGQVERCGWWWNWVNKRIYEQAKEIPDRVRVLRLEDAVAAGDDLGVDLLGVPKSLPVENTSTAPEPVSGWEPYVVEMAEVLGYGY